MASRRHVETGGNVRHTVRAESLDFIAYKSWKASSEREVKHTHDWLGWKWDTWDRSGRSLDFTAIFVAGDGSQLPNPARTASTGYQSEEQWAWFSGAVPSDQAAAQVEGLTVDYNFDGKAFTLTVGRNYVTLVIAAVVIIVALLVFGFATGFFPL
jgi:hypothetical protein